MMSLGNLVRKMDVSRIDVPILVMYSPQDRVVDPSKIGNTVATFNPNNTTIVSIEEPDDPARHVLASDMLSPPTSPSALDTIETFVNDGGTRAIATMAYLARQSSRVRPCLLDNRTQRGSPTRSTTALFSTKGD